MQNLDSSFLPSGNKPFIILYFLFLLAYFVNFNRDHQYVIYGLLLLASLPALWASRRAFLLSAPLAWAAALLLYLTVSFFWSEDTQLAYFLEVLFRASLTLSFLLITSWFVWQRPQEFSRVLTTMVVCVALVGVLSIVLFYAENPFPDARLVSFGQLNNAAYMGSVNGVFAVIAGYFAIVAQTTRVRAACAMAFIVLLAVILMTQTRSAFIALLAGILVLVIGQVKSHAVRNSIAIGILSGIYILGKPLYSRFSTAGIDVSSDLRLQIWQAVFAEIYRSPVIGAGIGTKMQFDTSAGLFSHPHSVYLSIAWYGGILGLFLLLGTLLAAYRECILEARQRSNYLALALLVYTTLCVLVDYSELLTFPRDIWVLFWLAIAVAGGIAINRKLNHHTAT